MEDERGDYNPGIVFPRRQDFRDVVRMHHRLNRRNDPEHTGALERAVERLANSPAEAREALALIAQLERDDNLAVREEICQASCSLSGMAAIPGTPFGNGKSPERTDAPRGS